MPGKSPGPSIKKPKMYEALKEEAGMSKEKAARISNAAAAGTLRRGKKKTHAKTKKKTTTKKK